MRRSMRVDPDRQLFESLQHLSRIQARRGSVKAALTYSHRAGGVAASRERTGALPLRSLEQPRVDQMQAASSSRRARRSRRRWPSSLQQSVDDPNRKDGRIRHNLGSVL